jgi:hypothetical protein
MVVSRGRNVGSRLLRQHHRFFQEQTQVLAPAEAKERSWGRVERCNTRT